MVESKNEIYKMTTRKKEQTTNIINIEQNSSSSMIVVVVVVVIIAPCKFLFKYSSQISSWSSKNQIFRPKELLFPHFIFD